ncbi:MAG: hypothetical protein ACLR8Y_16260 [Alistipes indistinctus]
MQDHVGPWIVFWMRSASSKAIVNEKAACSAPNAWIRTSASSGTDESAGVLDRYFSLSGDETGPKFWRIFASIRAKCVSEIKYSAYILSADADALPRVGLSHADEAVTEDFHRPFRLSAFVRLSRRLSCF